MTFRLKRRWQKIKVPWPGEWYVWGDTVAGVSLDGGLWHMSISTKNRYPTWEEIKAGWYELVPGARERTGAILLPPVEEFVNMHENCFHVYELAKDEIPQEVGKVQL